MTTIEIILGIILGYLIIAIPKSFYVPRPMHIQAILLFNKAYKIISNLLNDDEEKTNIRFFLWPFFKVHTYELTYTKAIKKGAERPEDKTIWESGTDIVVSRRNTSNHLLEEASYPTISESLETLDFFKVRIYSNIILKVTDPKKVLFSIDDWMVFSNSVINGGLRGLIASLTLKEINQISSGGNSGSFNEKLLKILNGIEFGKKKLNDIGLEATRAVFIDFEPADERAQEMLRALNEKNLQTEKGEGLIAEAKAKAEAYAVEQGALILWKKNYLVDTGLAKTDSSGNIIELLPDANARISAEAIRELSKLTGTLVLGDETMKMLNLNKPQS